MNAAGWDAGDHYTVFTATFEGNGSARLLHLAGYDVGNANEVGLYLNGLRLGFLPVGASNGLTADLLWWLPELWLVDGINRIELRQEQAAGGDWGVTRLALYELGSGFGNLISLPGDTAHAQGINLYLPGNGGAQLLTLRGYDIDGNSEVELRLNGDALGTLPGWPDRAWSDPARLYLPAAKLFTDGVNLIEARNRIDPSSDWGLAFDALRSGDTELGRFPGGESALGDTNSVTYLVPTFNANPQIDLRFFDVDDFETVEIQVEGSVVQNATTTPSNAWGALERMLLTQDSDVGELLELTLDNSDDPSQSNGWGVRFEGWQSTVSCGEDDGSFTPMPNLIVIMADDLGYADVGFNGGVEIPTPNIDRIAEEGITFTNAYTPYPVCSPSRAGFITGRYPQRFGYERNVQYQPNDPNMGLSQEERTLSEALSEAGYHSGIIGKWHLGASPSHHPLSRGFDEFYGHLGGGHLYFPEDLIYEDSYAIEDEAQSYRTWIMRGHDSELTSKYLTEEFSDEAISFIERNGERPFFLFLSYNAPHTPMQATEEYLSRFEHIDDGLRRTYAAMVSAMDDGVGALLDRLEELGLTENTMLFFLSDNGGPESVNGSDNGPLRGAKSLAYEGGYRVPFALRWGDHLESGIYEHPVTSLDIFATITSLAGVSEEGGKPLDGVNLYPYLNSAAARSNYAPHDSIYLRQWDQERFAVRHGDYKLITFDNLERMELYNITNDIGESSDLAHILPEVLGNLDSLRDSWNQELIEPAFLGISH